MFYPFARAADYRVVEGEDSFYMRIDQAEGIDASARPLFVSPDLEDWPVVDVGCGVGFTADFARHSGRQVQAFDPSSAAEMSTRRLGIDITPGVATPDSIIMREPRLVFSSEVIEHVESPMEFLSALRAMAGESGYVLVTTPNAGFVSPDTASDILLAMLGPSQHLFLLSKESLADLATQVQFPWFFTWAEDERLFLLAGPRPVAIRNTFSRTAYVQYLEDRLDNGTWIAEDLRMRTFGYRLFKELVHAGRFDEASTRFAQLTDSYARLGLNLLEPDEVVSRYRASAGRVGHLPSPRTFPINTPLLLFLRGTASLAWEHDRIGAAAYLNAAIDLAGVYARAFTSQGALQSYDVELQRVAAWAQAEIREHGLERHS